MHFAPRIGATTYFAFTVLIALTIWLYAARLRIRAEAIYLRAPFKVQIVTSLYIFLVKVHLARHN
jgi:hypothetical protein